MQKGPLWLGIGALVLIAILYFGGKTINPGSSQKGKSMPSAGAEISWESYISQQAALLPAEEQETHKSLQKAAADAPSNDTAAVNQSIRALVEFWQQRKNPPLTAYYYYKLASANPSGTTFEAAGDGFVLALNNHPDSIISNNLITFALRSYEQAIERDPESVELRIKLADVYVQGSPEPMKGITMLRQLADSLPDNIPALLALGRLSIQSGQYDKAKERLQKVLQLEPQNTEAIYFLAISEAELGHTDEAVRLFELCKMLVGNEAFNKEIDEIIKNLKSKKV